MTKGVEVQGSLQMVRMCIIVNPISVCSWEVRDLCVGWRGRVANKSPATVATV